MVRFHVFGVSTVGVGGLYTRSWYICHGVRSQRMNLAVLLVGVDVYSSLYLKIESCD